MSTALLTIQNLQCKTALLTIQYVQCTVHYTDNKTICYCTYTDNNTTPIRCTLATIITIQYLRGTVCTTLITIQYVECTHYTDNNTVYTTVQQHQPEALITLSDCQQSCYSARLTGVVVV